MHLGWLPETQDEHHGKIRGDERWPWVRSGGKCTWGRGWVLVTDWLKWKGKRKQIEDDREEYLCVR